MEQQVSWHWPPSGEHDDPAPPDFAETCFCPCLVYSRTLARLNAAFAGQNPQRIPNANCIDLNSCNFVLCLPFWGFSIARLQATVRSFYGIKGNTTND
ncbi:hypothetical protein LMH87_010880 [Akanthomyces muscarius]|uniref:Uncharacterized protein n=1 Tax=Akanthomyces muscarius TaxID=2231603 RepID=A0A9W8Q8M8_AKAMU|nr:hypothetical protein LMH87_010880 [Akanthomyces muscarius]KAJ4150115.1 hypothetical protein LMH87_010880 [Akanthomyces muscarius]